MQDVESGEFNDRKIALNFSKSTPNKSEVWFMKKTDYNRVHNSW